MLLIFTSFFMSVPCEGTESLSPLPNHLQVPMEILTFAVDRFLGNCAGLHLNDNAKLQIKFELYSAKLNKFYVKSRI